MYFCLQLNIQLNNAFVCVCVCLCVATQWRELAKQLDGVVKIGAVNCMDDWALCNQEQIHGFPSLVMYPSRVRYEHAKTLDQLLAFALSHTTGAYIRLNTVASLQQQQQQNGQKDIPLLVSFCLTTTSNNGGEEEEDEEDTLNYELNCLDDSTLTKLAIMLEGVASVASVSCAADNAAAELCSSLLRPRRSSPLVYYARWSDVGTATLPIQLPASTGSSDYKQMARHVMSLLADGARSLADNAELDAVLAKLRRRDHQPLLVHFDNVNANEQPGNGNNMDQELELKRLPPLLAKAGYSFARVDCLTLVDTDNDCSRRYQLTTAPAFVLFKQTPPPPKSVENSHNDADTTDDTWYEVFYAARSTASGGLVSASELAKFVKDNARTLVRTLTDRHLLASSSSSSLSSLFMAREAAAYARLAYYVDFFAPWCPPCMALLPEYRAAARLDTAAPHALFATVDCAQNAAVCQHFGVHSYPTTMLFNVSGGSSAAPQAHTYVGAHTAADIADFVLDVLKPSVVTLDYASFYELVGDKASGDVWLVDFYASWCGPCQQLAPEWRKLAKRLASDTVHVGHVDCVLEQALCQEQQVHSYPNIRVYPMGGDGGGAGRYEMFQGWMRDANSIGQWAANFLPSKAHKLDMSNFERLVFKNKSSDGTCPFLRHQLYIYIIYLYIYVCLLILCVFLLLLVMKRAVVD